MVDFHAVLRIREVYFGSRILIFSIPDPASRVKKIPGSGSASASKNLSNLTQKIVSKTLGNMILDVQPGSGFCFFYPSRIPDLDPQHCSKKFIHSFYSAFLNEDTTCPVTVYFPDQ